MYLQVHTPLVVTLISDELSECWISAANYCIAISIITFELYYNLYVHPDVPA